MLAAETAIRSWVNSKPGLVGPGNPLAGGAFLRQQRSPADGAYAVLARAGGSSDMVAEQDPNLCAAVIIAQIYSPAEDAAERAAAALMTEIEQLTGCPEPAGDSGLTILVADKTLGPTFIPQPPDSGEPYCFQIQAEFTLAEM
jgi:hypothetical protein